MNNFPFNLDTYRRRYNGRWTAFYGPWTGMLLLVRSLFILLKDIYFIPVPLRSMHWNIVYGVEPAIFLFSRFTICFLFRSAPLRSVENNMADEAFSNLPLDHTENFWADFLTRVSFMSFSVVGPVFPVLFSVCYSQFQISCQPKT